MSMLRKPMYLLTFSEALARALEGETVGRPAVVRRSSGQYVLEGEVLLLAQDDGVFYEWAPYCERKPWVLSGWDAKLSWRVVRKGEWL